jgi:hypothetical protein
VKDFHECGLLKWVAASRQDAWFPEKVAHFGPQALILRAYEAICSASYCGHTIVNFGLETRRMPPQIRLASQSVAIGWKYHCGLGGFDLRAIQTGEELILWGNMRQDAREVVLKPSRIGRSTALVIVLRSGRHGFTRSPAGASGHRFQSQTRGASQEPLCSMPPIALLDSVTTSTRYMLHVP